MSAENSSSNYHADQSKLPKGNYDASITEASVVLREPEGYHRVHIDFEIKTHGHVGQPVFKEYHLTTKKAAEFLRGEFTKMGVAVNGPEDLEGACKAVEGKDVRLSVNYQPNGNRAVYITGEGSGQPSKQGNYEQIWG